MKRIRGEAQAKLFLQFFVVAAVFQVIRGSLVFFQFLTKKLLGFLEQGKDTFFLFGRCFGESLLFYFHSRFFGEELDGFGEIYIFYFLNESKNISSLAAAEA